MAGHRFELVWIVPAGLLVALQLAVAWMLGSRFGFDYAQAAALYLMLATLVAVVAAVGIPLVVALSYPFRRIGHPLAALKRDTGAIVVRIVMTVAAIYLVGLQWCALGWLKAMIPLVTGFTADPLLARIDHAMFGTDPWTLLHMIIGNSAPLIDQAYLSWSPVSWGVLTFSTALILVFLPPSRARTVAFLAYFLMLGFDALCGQFLLPSAGPIFYRDLGLGDRFAAIPVHHWSQMAHDYLWAGYLGRTGSAGAGISAFPSMHIALAVWQALAWSTWRRWLAVPGFAFAGLIVVGSVYLGWHYAVDALGGMALAAVAWALAHCVVRVAMLKAAALEPLAEPATA